MSIFVRLRSRVDSIQQLMNSFDVVALGSVEHHLFHGREIGAPILRGKIACVR
ncbi:hypothetical protein PISMIDRAFT_680728 [Pisolithus microcarpus 441]|uniref:Uncharacterized protein n=1 Tax=Pisolithus microcarpus 441 TaxID=765257 RepID=A0A0C9ZHN1_9AGAM|nr:hypothetical protein PISMIDRAFT_680728 [Pisolithus microcarpus 441]